MAKISYVGMNHGEIRQTWIQETGTRDYTLYELQGIDRKWRSLGKKVASGARIPDGNPGKAHRS